MKEVKNDTNVAKYVATPGGARLLQPGESLMVDDPVATQATDMPTPRAVQLAGDNSGNESGTDDEALREVLDDSIAAIKPQLAEMDEKMLSRLLELEKQDGSPRVGLISEIEANLLAIKAKT